MVGVMAKEISVEDLLQESDPSKKIAGLSFEQALALLEQLVEGVESGVLPLDAAMLSYERGVSLVQHLREKLSGAEQKLKVLQREPGK